MRSRLATLFLAIAAGCSPKPAVETVSVTPSPSASSTPAAADPAYCKVLAEYVAAADGDFASLRTGEPEKMMRSWQASASLPGAIACRVADKDPMSFGSVFCVLSESADNAALEREYAAAVQNTKLCLQWKIDTGEQLQTRWTELVPPAQKSASRVLQAHVRLTEPNERAKGSVTIDVSVKRPGAKPAAPSE